MVVDIIYFIGILFMLLTGVNLLISKNKENSYSLLLLATYFILLAISNSFYFIIKYGVMNYVPHLYKSFAPITFLITPIGYFYIKKTLRNKSTWTLKERLHFLPAIIIAINYIPFYFTGAAEKREILEAVTNNLQNIVALDYKGFLNESFILLLRIAQSWIYLLLCWVLFLKEGNTLKNKNTKVHQWISVFIKLKTFYYVLLPLVYVGIFIVNQSSFESIESAKDIYFTIVFIFTSLFFFTLSIYLLIKPKLFVKLINYKAPTENKEGLTMDNIILTVSTNALYKDPELNLERLAKQINIKKSELTLIIQNSSYENFRDFLNTVRLENMVNHITKKDYEIKSITGLAKEYGFKSESTFYRIFKKQFNQTPQNYFSSSFL